MVRRARRRPLTARDGDLVIDACVRARLLGLPLLAIDATIVAAPARPAPRVTPPRPPRPVPDGDRRRPAPAAMPAPPSRPEIARAVLLIAEGSSLLDEARRVR